MDPARVHDLRTFGVFELDLTARELRRAGARIALQPQPFALLAALAARPGEIVTRAELQRAVWGAETFVDFERGLNFCVAQARRALRDDARAPRYIETLPRLGYRFVAPVTGTGALPQAHRETGRRRWPAWLAPAAFLLALAQHPSDSRSGEPLAAPGPSDAYVKGLYHFSRGALEWVDAARWLERAVEENPASVPARTALAATYVSLAEARLRDPREAFALAERAARAALAIDPASAEARTWAAVARLYGAWDWTTAGRELPRAIALDPHLVAGRRAYAAYLAAVGNLGGAVEQIEVARRLDPVCSALRGEAAWYRYCARRYDEAAALCRSSLAVRDDSGPHEALFQIHRLARRDAAAAREALRVMVLVGVPEATVSSISRRPASEVVRLFLEGAIEHVGRDAATTPERLAALHAALGDADPAFVLLERGCAEHSPGLPRALRDPAFDRIRGDRRFQDVLACVGLAASGDDARRILLDG